MSVAQSFSQLGALCLFAGIAGERYLHARLEIRQGGTTPVHQHLVADIEDEEAGRDDRAEASDHHPEEPPVMIDALRVCNGEKPDGDKEEIERGQALRGAVLEPVPGIVEFELELELLRLRRVRR